MSRCCLCWSGKAGGNRNCSHSASCVTTHRNCSSLVAVVSVRDDKRSASTARIYEKKSLWSSITFSIQCFRRMCRQARHHPSGNAHAGECVGVYDWQCLSSSIIYSIYRENSIHEKQTSYLPSAYWLQKAERVGFCLLFDSSGRSKPVLGLSALKSAPSYIGVPY